MCVYIHAYLQGVYIKAHQSFLDEKVLSFSSKPCFIMMTRRSADKFYYPSAPLLAPSVSTSQRLLTIYGKKTVH